MDTVIKANKSEILHLNEWKFWSFFLLFSALIFAYPFYSNEYLNHVDAPFHLNRIEGIKESLLGGEFPVRIHGYQMNGYGTADGVMYPSLLLYFPAFLRILGVPIAISWNVFWTFLIVFGLFAAFIGFTIWTQNLRKGAVAALFFQSSEMGFHCLGHAVGDHPAFFLLPLAIGSLLKMLEDEKYAKYWPIFVISFTLIFECHIITTLILSILLIVILLLNYKAFKNKIQGTAIFKSAIFCFLLNIWFAAPFLYFYKTVVFHIYDSKPISLHNSTLNFNELFFSQFYLGLPLLLLLIFFLINKKTRQNMFFVKCFFVYVLLIFCLHENFPWEWIETHIPGGNFLPKLQFPLRFLPYGTVFLICCLGSLFVDMFNSKKRYLLGFSAFLIFTFSVILHPYMPLYVLNHIRVTNMEYKAMDFLPSYTQEGFRLQEDYLYADVNFYELRNEKNEVYSSKDYKTDAKILNTKKQGTRLEFSYIADKNTKVQVPLFYWKGYEAKDENGNKLDVYSGKHRFMEISVPKGEHKVKVHYAGLNSFRIFDFVSFVTFIVFCFILVRNFKKKFNFI